MPLSRRQFLDRAGWGACGLALTGVGWRGLRPVATLDIAYAGSMTAVMEGPLAQAVLSLGMRLQGRAQGSDALARLIIAGSLHPDVFAAITASPMAIVTRAGMVQAPQAFATTAMSIAYAPNGRWARAFAQQPWWKVLEAPGFRFGRSDPRTDPQGRNIIYTCRLAEAHYGQPDLARRILGPVINPEQIFSESTLPARVQSGQLDAAATYAFQPKPFGLAAVTLPEAINLSALDERAQGLRLDLEGREYHPEALIFYAAVLKQAPHHAAAERFVQWLQGGNAQAILEAAGYGPRPREELHG